MVAASIQTMKQLPRESQSGGRQHLRRTQPVRSPAHQDRLWGGEANADLRLGVEQRAVRVLGVARLVQAAGVEQLAPVAFEQVVADRLPGSMLVAPADGVVPATQVQRERDRVRQNANFKFVTSLNNRCNVKRDVLADPDNYRDGPKGQHLLELVQISAQDVLHSLD